jgi:hypothetical protein
VEAKPPRGLGGRVSQLIALCGKDAALAEEVRRLVLADIPAAKTVGRPKKGSATPNLGHRRDAAEFTARLKRDDPDLAGRVVRGEVSPNAAARQMGWRKPRLLVTSPEAVARKLREYFTPDQLAELIRLLTGSGGA